MFYFTSLIFTIANPASFVPPFLLLRALDVHNCRLHFPSVATFLGTAGMNSTGMQLPDCPCFHPTISGPCFCFLCTSLYSLRNDLTFCKKVHSISPIFKQLNCDTFEWRPFSCELIVAGPAAVSVCPQSG